MVTGRLAALVVAVILLPVMSMAVEKRVSIDDFRALDGWSVNGDGGSLEISADKEHTRLGNPSMRLKFVLGQFQWGNAARAITLPPEAIAVEFDLFSREAASGAALFVWLFEEDGDGYVATADTGGKRLCDLPKDWRHVRVPIASFRYDPRGNKKREPLTVNKLLIGMGLGSADVSIANLEFVTVGRRSKMEPSQVENTRIQDGPKGRVAILDDRFPARPGNAKPDLLASALAAAGYGATMLKAADMANPAILTRANFDCLVLPYGPSYPYAAFDSIKAYLKSGGCFLSTGGYTFDEPCEMDESGKLVPMIGMVTAEDLAKEQAAPGCLNTRHGRYGDTLSLDPDQIGVFDPGYILPDIHELSGAIWDVAPEGIAGPVWQGYAACAMLGSNNPVFPEKWGRLIPVVEGLDELHRPAGPVGSMAYNYAGPYAGSAWAFFGITNADLFAKDGFLLPHIGAIVDRLTRRVFLHSLATDMAYYDKKETVGITCRVANLGKKEQSGKVRFSVIDRRHGSIVACKPNDIPVRLEPGETSVVQTSLKWPFDSDQYTVMATLYLDDGSVDQLETGFVVANPEVMAAGLKLNYKDNYFRAGDRPVLLSGTNQTGAIFFSENENPLVWDRDLARMNENGLNIVRVLHFSPFVSDKPTPAAVKPMDLAIERLPRRIERQLDALVQLCQKHRIALFLSIHDWMGQALSDAELAAQRKYAKLIAARYKDVPGFMIDIQNEPHVEFPREPGKYPTPDVIKHWNDYLRVKYKTDDALKAAWKTSPPEKPIGGIDYHAGTDAWDDMRTFDADYFRNVLIDRWIDANYTGAMEGDSEMPVTVGFLQEYWALNKLMSVDRLDFANMHSYNSIEVLRADLKLFDRRFQGKSISMGEFGSLADHDKRIQGLDNPAQDYNRFLLTGHYAFGLGGSFIANWCWKDMEGVVFPWGINYPCGGPRKDILKAYRNQSLLMRQVEPVYKTPEVFLVVPTSTMLGGSSSVVVQALYKHVDALLDSRADFGTIDDQHLDQLPASAKLLVYPIPMSIPDKAYGPLKLFVEKGGTLCISGDVSYDQLRRRTLTDRLADLCGVRFVSENYPGVSWGSECKPCINVEPAGAAQDGAFYHYKLGQGEVRYTPYPLQAFPLQPLGAGAIVQATSGHAFRLQEKNGGLTLILVNPTDKTQIVSLSEPACEMVELSLEPNGTGLARFDDSGKLVAVESHGPVKIGEKRIEGKGHFALISGDSRPLLETGGLIVLPFGGADVDLSPLKGLADEVQEIGDVVDGKWQTLATPASTRVQTTPITAFDIHILAPKDRLEGLRMRVVEELMLKPL